MVEELGLECGVVGSVGQRNYTVITSAFARAAPAGMRA